METKNPIEGVRLPGAVASLRSRDDSLRTCRRGASVYLELASSERAGEGANRWSGRVGGGVTRSLTKMHLFSATVGPRVIDSVVVTSCDARRILFAKRSPPLTPLPSTPIRMIAIVPHQ